MGVGWDAHFVTIRMVNHHENWVAHVRKHVARPTEQFVSLGLGRGRGPTNSEKALVILEQKVISLGVFGHILDRKGQHDLMFPA